MSRPLSSSKSLPWRRFFFLLSQSLVFTSPLRAGEFGQLPGDAWRLRVDPGLLPGKLFESPPLAYAEPSRAFVPWHYRSDFNFDLLFGVMVPLEDSEDFDVGVMIG